MNRTHTPAHRPSVTCTRCGFLHDAGLIPAGGAFTCPHCSAKLEVQIFPALYRRPQAMDVSALAARQGEATCFYHPDKKAAVPCEACGRFLCSLCDIDLGGRHLCPSCVASSKKRGADTRLASDTVRYDKIAYALAVYPLVLIVTVYLTIITAPIALYIVVRYWKRPSSVVHTSRLYFTIALLASLLEIVGWVILILFLIGSTGR